MILLPLVPGSLVVLQTLNFLSIVILACQDYFEFQNLNSERVIYFRGTNEIIIQKNHRRKFKVLSP